MGWKSRLFVLVVVPFLAGTFLDSQKIRHALELAVKAVIRRVAGIELDEKIQAAREVNKVGLKEIDDSFEVSYTQWRIIIGANGANRF